MEEGRSDRGGVQIEPRQDLADLDAMRDVILARLALLPLVRPLAVFEGPPQQIEIQPYACLLDRLDKVLRQRAVSGFPGPRVLLSDLFQHLRFWLARGTAAARIGGDREQGSARLTALSVTVKQGPARAHDV